MMTPRPTRGFTLIEMIVSVGIFAVVMTIVMSAYLTLIKVDRRARATNQVVSNLSFAVDAMVRGIRTGRSYRCNDGSPDANGNSTTGTCTCFSYTDSGLNTTVTYHLMANNTIGRAVGSSSCLDGAASPITDPAITISTLAFWVRGAGSGVNDLQAQTLFTVKGTMPADASGNTASFTIEESATQRLIDI